MHSPTPGKSQDAAFYEREISRSYAQLLSKERNIMPLDIAHIKMQMMVYIPSKQNQLAYWDKVIFDWPFDKKEIYNSIFKELNEELRCKFSTIPISL